ncbi:toxin-antitoxin system YwqK family antitoxin [Trinickia terrae]|uniref:Toxin-antitoxin system YwqK family antitoxin n=1 Tax=Trinickia terrae TaxID=2571161 RepID=A0A4V5PIK2_9BURK|nr:toxin-antitoxin system YwqK family antitoxin [Trinickia terrae]TKC87720.1 toxin-antitoxin system YwqK family antitoxin [Trinickia terrae]
MSPLPPTAEPAASVAAPGASAHATLMETRDATGRLVSRMPMLDGVPHGQVVMYGALAVPVLEAHYEHGALSGLVRTFDTTGALLQEAAYVAGQLHGTTTTWQDGRVASRQHYAHGVLHGTAVFYAPSGLVSARLAYEAGKLTGEALHLHEGTVVRRASYSKGVLEGETRDYASDGTLVQASPYKGGLLHGTVRRYGADGRVNEERAYANGKPLGEARKVAAPAPQDGAATGGQRLAKQLEKWVKG